MDANKVKKFQDLTYSIEREEYQIKRLREAKVAELKKELGKL